MQDQDALNKALLKAVTDKNIDEVQRSIAGGADANTRDKDGNNVLYKAAYHGYTQIVQLLLKHGASIIEEPLDNIIAPNRKEICHLFITDSIFCPYLSEQEFQNSQEFVLACLLGFKRVCPKMPKDLRKLLLNYTPESKKHTENSGVFGKYKNVTLEQVPLLPRPVVRCLIQNGRFEQEIAVAEILKYQCISVRPIVITIKQESRQNEEWIGYHGDTWDDIIRRKCGAEIEANIKKSLGIEPSSKCEIQ